MKKLSVVILAVSLVIFLSGCGETIRGIGSDFNRVGRGIKTIFISDYR
jgi:predicted small secreted protein